MWEWRNIYVIKLKRRNINNIVVFFYFFKKLINLYKVVKNIMFVINKD